MKEDVGFFATNGHIGGRTFSHGVWRGRNILGFFILAEFLFGVCFDVLFLSVKCV